MTGETESWSWSWDIRSVNARGLDMRMRVPDWIEGLEPKLRQLVQKSAARGNISLSLRVQAEARTSSEEIDAEALDRTLNMIAEVEFAAQEKGLKLTPATPTSILASNGVISSASTEQDTAALGKALLAQFPELLSAFNDMRATEGQALFDVISKQLDQIDALTKEAAACAEARRDQMATNFRENLARVLENSDGADADRVAQELAILAVKSDVTEEIDRLHGHVAAARDVLAADGPVGRKLDFLSQEFNREANTLCSKAQFSDLTTIGLNLKTVIDQMREQVQNME